MSKLLTEMRQYINLLESTDEDIDEGVFDKVKDVKNKLVDKKWISERKKQVDLIYKHPIKILEIKNPSLALQAYAVKCFEHKVFISKHLDLGVYKDYESDWLLNKFQNKDDVIKYMEENPSYVPNKNAESTQPSHPGRPYNRYTGRTTKFNGRPLRRGD